MQKPNFLRIYIFPLILLLLLLYVISPSPAFAKEERVQIKFVFPFGNAQPRKCLPQNQTLDGCCPNINRIYNRHGDKGCCPAGLPIETVGANQGCCSIITPPQTRWGQTQSSPCGGHCAAGSAVLSYNTVSSCCTNCQHNDDVRAFSSEGNVCGTCCSKIPDSCGNAGYRVCESATGSAYCSIDPAKCSNPGEFTVGSSGQGGYSCCASCNGAYAGTTTSSCGVCCTANEQAFLIEGNWECIAKPACTNTSFNIATKKWHCFDCYKNNAFYASGSCTYEGTNADTTCAAAQTCYSCSTYTYNKYYCDRKEWNFDANGIQFGVSGSISRFYNTACTRAATNGSDGFHNYCIFDGVNAHQCYSGCRADCTSCYLAGETVRNSVKFWPAPRSLYLCGTVTSTFNSCLRDGVNYKTTAACTYAGTCANATCTAAQPLNTCETRSYIE